MSSRLMRRTHRRGGALAGCLIVLGILVVLVVIGVIVVAMNWKGWAANAATSIAEQAIQASDLPESEKTEVLAEISRVADGFKSGDISIEDFLNIAGEIAEGPLIPAAVVGGFEKAYIEPSGLSEEEQAGGGLALARVAQAVSENKIEADPLKAIFNPIQTATTTGTGVHINHPKFTLHLKDPKDCSDDELREVVANAVAAADEAEIPNERMDFDPSDELKKSIDKVLSGEHDHDGEDHEHGEGDEDTEAHADDDSDAGEEGP